MIFLALVPTTVQARRTGLFETLPAPAAFGTVPLAMLDTPYNGQWARVARSRVPASSGIAGRAMSASGMAQLRLVNRAVNGAVAYRDDTANWRSPDYWATGPETLARGAGDCEDFAITKMQILTSAGFPAGDLFLVIGSDLAMGSPHAVLIARIGGDFWVLDNLHDEVRLAATYSHFRPMLSFNANGRWLHGYPPGQGPGRSVLAAEGRLASIIAAQSATRAF